MNQSPCSACETETEADGLALECTARYSSQLFRPIIKFGTTVCEGRCFTDL